MTIRYLHNDPDAVPFLESRRSARPARVGAVAKFSLSHPPAEQIYPIGDPGFVFWQCRQAALLAIEAWELVSGPLRSWQSGSRLLILDPNRAVGLEANYDRASVSFNRWPVQGTTTFTGASTDAVSHEVGHAILDAVRPDLWDSLFAEVAAFHEGFADCVTLLVALFDNKVVDALFNGAPNPKHVLDAGNLAGQVAESVASAFLSSFGAHHPNSRPRQLKNQLQWAIPTTLPANPTPTNLSREPHSFGRVFSGCVYDTIDNIYQSRPRHTRRALKQAATTAGALLAAAVKSAPEDIRFYRAVGRAMILADDDQNGGANHVAIRDAFAAHGIALGSAVMLAATMALEGPPPPVRGAASRRLNPRTRRDLSVRVGSDGPTRMSIEPVQLGGRRVAKVKLRRKIPLVNVSGSLQGVMAHVNEELLLGAERKYCVVLGELPNSAASDIEVSAFARSLADSGALEHPADRSRKPTHAIRKRDGRKFLKRVRFSCVPAGYQ
ncbi:MAG: hypothetical protein O7H39_17775 [Gammaproteobacteria bacterium]|nr:hypothetical protein [Gammaproteobacteria bacterium]